MMNVDWNLVQKASIYSTMEVNIDILAPFLLTRINLNYPFLNNNVAVEVSEWMSAFIPH